MSNHEHGSMHIAIAKGYYLALTHTHSHMAAGKRLNTILITQKLSSFVCL